MTNKKFYLAHNFGSRFKVRDYIMPILEEIYDGWDIVNPFMIQERHNEGLFEYKGSSEGEAKKYIFANTPIDDRNSLIVERDLYWIDQCDALVAYIERPSVGTSMEIFYMKYVLKKPVTLVFDTEIDLINHPWLLYFSDSVITLDKRGIYPLTNGVKLDLKVLEAFQKYGYEVAHLLAVKNVAYGKSASNLSYEGINKRINEKTMRIANLRAQGLEGNDDESIRETIIDIGGYALLQLMCHDKAFPFQEGFREQSLLDAYTTEELEFELKRRELDPR
jgi:nucleoside 2-deoxyribosyltransferase